MNQRKIWGLFALWQGFMLALAPSSAEACTAFVVQSELEQVEKALPGAKLSPNTRERVLTMQARAAYLHQVGLEKAAVEALDGPMLALGLARVADPMGRKCR